MGLVQSLLPLTVLQPELEAARRSTHPGMAHFAGSGPSDKTCRECTFWTGCGIVTGYYSKNGMKGGAIKPRACAKHQSLMNGEVGPSVPHNARACRHFEQNGNPPAPFLTK